MVNFPKARIFLTAKAKQCQRKTRETRLGSNYGLKHSASITGHYWATLSNTGQRFQVIYQEAIRITYTLWELHSRRRIDPIVFSLLHFYNSVFFKVVCYGSSSFFRVFNCHLQNCATKQRMSFLQCRSSANTRCDRITGIE